jgi:hypothetical protein
MLLSLIETYLRQTGISPTRFGRDAVSDPRLVHDLRHGRTVGDKIVRRVTAFIEANRS